MDAHEGPVVIGYDGGPGAADGLAFGLRWAAQLGSDAVVVVIRAPAARKGFEPLTREFSAVAACHG